MLRLKIFVLTTLFALVSFTANAYADEMFEVHGNAGIAMMDDGDEGNTGVGVDITVGLPVGFGLVPEVLAGVLVNSLGEGWSYNNVLLMGGVRFDVPLDLVIQPYVYAHAGLCAFSYSHGDYETDSTAEFGVNLGAGVRYVVSDTLGVGIGGGPLMVFRETTTTYIRGGVSALFKL